MGETTTGVRTDEVHEAPRGRWTVDGSHHRSDRMLGGVVLLVWAAWLVLTAMTQTVSVGTDRLEEDLAAGDVVAWQRVDVAERDQGVGAWAGRIDTMPLDEADDGTGPGRPAVEYWTDSPLVRSLVVEGEDFLREAPARFAQAGVPRVDALPDQGAVRGGPQAWASGLAVLAVVMTLAGLVVGPTPTRGSRWFWFWLLFLPLGLGVLAYAALELVRPSTRPSTAAHPRRLRGIQGFGLWILGSIVVPVAGAVLGSLTGWTFVALP